MHEKTDSVDRFGFYLLCTIINFHGGALECSKIKESCKPINSCMTMAF
jgi:hypothetical protein